MKALTDQEPVAWLCEFVTACDGTERQVVFEDPAGLRWNDAGEPSPFRVTPLYALPTPATLAPKCNHPWCGDSSDHRHAPSGVEQTDCRNSNEKNEAVRALNAKLQKAYDEGVKRSWESRATLRASAITEPKK